MADTARAYRTLLGSRLRAQTAYRTSFALDLVGQAGLGLMELAEISVIFHNVPALGGLALGPALLVFALANVGESLADAVCGHLDRLPELIRAGTLDAMLLRPLPLLGQLVTSDLSLRRLSRTAIALLTLAVAAPMAVSDWTPARLALVVLTPLVAMAVFSGLFAAAAAAQFWLVEGAELTNSLTYGSRYVASYPASILARPVRTFFTFVVPATFTAYLPTLALTGLPGPAGLPSWLGWCAPVAAVVLWSAVGVAWRSGVRHYTGAGG